MNICVFCSAYVLEEKYAAPARELAKVIAEAGHNLVWGGSYVGIMKVMADGVREGGGKIYGVSVEAYRHNNHESADEMVMAKDLGARKAAMLSKSDAVVVLPGGIGTLDEVTDVLELKKQGHHQKPIIIMDIDGFYDGLKTQLNRMFKEGFIPPGLEDIIYFAKNVEDVTVYLGQKT